jgi:hypothetical protein
MFAQSYEWLYIASMKNNTTPAPSTKPIDRKEKNQGSKWIRQEKRLAIYMRDGLACVWCGIGIESGAQLSLDHLTPYSHGGSNDETNLVTCCSRCNSSRGNRSTKAFAAAVAGYINHGATAKQILKQIETTTKRPLDVKSAKEMIAARGSYSAVMNGK